MYLSEDTTLESLPDAVKKQLGDPEKTLEFDLAAREALPNADKAEVMESLQTQGFYIQMPRDIESILEGLGRNGSTES